LGLNALNPPLYGRKNIVLSRDESFNPEGTIVLRDLKEALFNLKQEVINNQKEQ